MANDLVVHNSLTREKSAFVPIKAGQVSMYVCGPTVQSSPHIGHMRSGISFDVIRRYLQATVGKVEFVMNVTDIDDKILNKSANEGVHWQEHALKYEKEFFDCYEMLGILKPDHIPHATAYIPQQIAMVQKLIDNGYAYQGAPGDVWFDTVAWQDYGELTRQTNSDELEVSDDDFRDEKRNPRDFALWKSPHDSDPDDASWDSPWGRGRPGWHLECSAMSTDILGSKFDIHGGGLDLRFPHHENEIAQSRASGNDFAQVWLHHSWVTAKGEKMSKSLGNGLSVYEVIKDHPLAALALRYAMSSVHYRTQIEWTKETMDASLKAIERIYKQLETSGGKYTDDLVNSVDINLFPEFTKPMNDDFNVSGALAAIHGALKSDVPVLHIRRALSILGIDPMSDHWRPVIEAALATSSPESDNISDEKRTEIEQLIEQRTAAKRARDFATADGVRDTLTKMGVELTDTPDGTTWKLG